MKKLGLILGLIWCIALAGFAGDGNGHKIKIKINGYQDTTCYLAGYYGAKEYYKDTAFFDANGVCIFEGDEELPGGIYSVVLNNFKLFEFIVKEQEFSLETDTGKLIENMQVKGSIENELFFDHFRLVASLQKESGELDKKLKQLNAEGKKDTAAIVKKRLKDIGSEVGNYKEKIIKDYPSTLLSKIFKGMKDPTIPDAPKDEEGKQLDSLFQYKYLKAHYWDNIDFSDSDILRTPIYHNRMVQYIKKLVPQIPDSINKSADILINKTRANDEIFRYTLGKITYMYETSKIMGMDAVFVHLADKYYMTNQAFWVDSVQLFKISDRVRSIKPTLIGKQAPPIYHMKDQDGKLIPLYSVDANLLIVIFWDPDCGHCKKEMPKLKDVCQKYKDDEVKVYAVCTEVEQGKWIKYIENDSTGWIHVADFELRSPFRELYNIDSTPKVFVLDKNKKIIAKHISHEQLDDILSRKFRRNHE